MTFPEIEQELRDALAHLYVASYRPSETICKLVGCAPEGGILALQSALLHAIEMLKPSPDTPQGSPAERIYAVLHNRFVLKRTLLATAERMHVSYSSVCRIQNTAIHALARWLWEHSATSSPQQMEAEPGTASGIQQADEWHTQLRRELAALQAGAPGRTSDVSQALTDALEVTEHVLRANGVRPVVRFVQPNLVAAVHPAVLRQVLITTLTRVAHQISGGEVAIYAALQDGSVQVALSGSLRGDIPHDHERLTADVLTAEGVSVGARIDNGTLFLSVAVPPVGVLRVLAIDDNPDMVRFYRSATLGTRYCIVEPSGEHSLGEFVRRERPDAIILDIMLPDQDGWRLLMSLHEDVSTRAVPVIVCTVVREPSLALSLGAAAYLAKPVDPTLLVETLDRVTSGRPHNSDLIP